MDARLIRPAPFFCLDLALVFCLFFLSLASLSFSHTHFHHSCCRLLTSCLAFRLHSSKFVERRLASRSRSIGKGPRRFLLEASTLSHSPASLPSDGSCLPSPFGSAVRPGGTVACQSLTRVLQLPHFEHLPSGQPPTAHAKQSKYQVHRFAFAFVTVLLCTLCSFMCAFQVGGRTLEFRS